MKDQKKICISTNKMQNQNYMAICKNLMKFNTLIVIFQQHLNISLT